MTTSFSSGRQILVVLVVCAVVATGCQWIALGSVGPGGLIANGPTIRAVVSDDGRYVVFLSSATNLTSDPPGVGFQVYRRDVVSGVTEMVSKQRGCGGGCVGPDGPASNISVVSDGDQISFESNATNLVPGDSDTNGAPDVFVVSMQSDGIFRLKPFGAQIAAGAERPSITESSALAQCLAFETTEALHADDTNSHPDVYLYCASTIGEFVFLISRSEITGEAGDGPSTHGLVSRDGSTVLFRSEASDLEAGAGVRWLWTSDWVSVDPVFSALGASVTTDAAPRGISDDGAVVAYWYRSTLPGAENTVATQGPGAGVGWTDHDDIALSGDGTRVVRLGTDDIAWLSDLPNAVFPVPDEIVSTDFVGDITSSAVIDIALSRDGRTATFVTPDAMLANDTNVWNDAYVRSVPALSISGINPATIPLGVETEITISGTGFYQNDLSLSVPGATINELQVLDGATITAKVVPGVLGPRNVNLILSNPGTGPLSGAVEVCAGCLTITP